MKISKNINSITNLTMINRPNYKNLRPQLTNGDILNIYKALTDVQGVQGTPLVYAISRSIPMMKPVYEAHQQDSLIPKSEVFKKYEDDLQKLHEKYSGGKHRQVSQGFVHDFPWLRDTKSEEYKGEQKKWEKEVFAFTEEHREVIKERNAQVDEYIKFLDDPFEGEISNYLHQITKEKLEECTAPEGLRPVLLYLIKEE